MDLRKEKLKELDETVEGCMDENGTIYTLGFAMDKTVDMVIRKCYEIGCKRVEVQAILKKYNG